mmetsp:Transcript_31764/g.47446  ORF Transcript_31764/g.47446 Transcript_31764/m.47446 type:complete len:223 (-) Transcript_31764:896-1564(-)
MSISHLDAGVTFLPVDDRSLIPMESSRKVARLASTQTQGSDERSTLPSIREGLPLLFFFAEAISIWRLSLKLTNFCAAYITSADHGSITLAFLFLFSTSFCDHLPSCTNALVAPSAVNGKAMLDSASLTSNSSDFSSSSFSDLSFFQTSPMAKHSKRCAMRSSAAVNTGLEVLASFGCFVAAANFLPSVPALTLGSRAIHPPLTSVVDLQIPSSIIELHSTN